MPGYNRRGPNGQGPMTGRKMGRCTNFGEKLKNQYNSKIDNVDENKNDMNKDFSDYYGFGIGKGMKRRYRMRNHDNCL